MRPSAATEYHGRYFLPESGSVLVSSYFMALLLRPYPFFTRQGEPTADFYMMVHEHGEGARDTA